MQFVFLGKYATKSAHGNFRGLCLSFQSFKNCWILQAYNHKCMNVIAFIQMSKGKCT